MNFAPTSRQHKPKRGKTVVARIVGELLVAMGAIERHKHGVFKSGVDQACFDRRV